MRYSNVFRQLKKRRKSNIHLIPHYRLLSYRHDLMWYLRLWRISVPLYFHLALFYKNYLLWYSVIVGGSGLWLGDNLGSPLYIVSLFLWPLRILCSSFSPNLHRFSYIRPNLFRPCFLFLKIIFLFRDILPRRLHSRKPLRSCRFPLYNTFSPVLGI